MEILAAQDSVAITFDKEQGMYVITQHYDYVDHSIYVAKANMARFIQALEECRREGEG